MHFILSFSVKGSWGRIKPTCEHRQGALFIPAPLFYLHYHILMIVFFFCIYYSRESTGNFLIPQTQREDQQAPSNSSISGQWDTAKLAVRWEGGGGRPLNQEYITKRAKSSWEQHHHARDNRWASISDILHSCSHKTLLTCRFSTHLAASYVNSLILLPSFFLSCLFVLLEQCFSFYLYASRNQKDWLFLITCAHFFCLHFQNCKRYLQM